MSSVRSKEGVGRPVVAVIGGGFSGLLTALHLLARPDGPQVRLVERRGVFGRGVAYGAHNPDHLLNVRIANMSAFPDAPDHFTGWLAGRDGWSAHGAFVSRGCYGDYLQSLLRDALSGGAADRLLLEPDAAVGLEREGGAWRVRLAMGRSFLAQATVLAVGAQASDLPEGLDPRLLASPRFRNDPWAHASPLPPGRILLLGSGLTMVDVALEHAAPDREFIAISRRGLLSRTHAEVAPHAAPSPPRGSPRAILREVRRRAGARDWREVIDDLRPHLTAIWRAWTAVERRRFLRHVRPWWDVHRHRLAPAVARRVAALQRSGALGIHAGRVERLTLMADGVEVRWRPRGGAVGRRVRVEAVVNCTGALGDIRRSGDPLLRGLLRSGLARPDACGLGADVDDRSRLLGGSGAPTLGLYAVGPLTRGAFWEITSVPDIRQQAAQVAAEIAEALVTMAAA